MLLGGPKNIDPYSIRACVAGEEMASYEMLM